MNPKKVILNKSLEKEKCISYFNRQGYGFNKENKNNIVLKKPGTIWTFYGKNMPLELTINFEAESTHLSLKYDAFALFDTGDLQNELDNISNGLTKAEFN
jgi:hypothetical protein